MCPVTQQGLGNACGACAAIHVVEHIWGASFAPKQSDVQNVWSKVQFESTQASTLKKMGQGDGTESDPFKIAKWLKEKHNLQCTLYVKGGSAVETLLGKLWSSNKPGSTKTGDGLDVNNIGKAKCAIGIYSCPGGLHYLAVYKSGNEYKFIDSNYKTPTWEKVSKLENIQGAMKYTYAGGSINVE